MTPYDPEAPLRPKLSRIRKLAVAVVGSGIALGAWLLTGESHSAEEILAAVLSFAGYNYGVWRVPNAE